MSCKDFIEKKENVTLLSVGNKTFEIGEKLNSNPEQYKTH